MKKIIKYISITILVIIVLLAATNPTPKDFGSYKYKYVQPEDEYYTYKFRRFRNWIIFSKYRDSKGYEYLGIFKNFFEIED